MAVIRLMDLTKRFGATTAVYRMNLEVMDREFIVLVGPSGCGKTTTLRMIAGLEDVTEGEIYIGDRMVNDVPPKARDIAMVFQNYALYPHMSVYKNITFALRLRKMPEDEIHKRVREAVGMLGIEDLLSRKPKELSGGQRQRVAMGRAIVRNPAVFLFDEPLSNLDAKLRVQMRGELSRLHHRLETTVVYVTHDQIEAMTLADRIVVMDRGRVRQIGRPLDVYDHPKDLFVAGFIGSPGMNLLGARVVDNNERLLVVGEKFSLLIPKGLEKGFRKAVDREVFLGIRPEHSHDIEQKRPFPGGEKFRVTVEVVEPIGSEVILVTSCGAGRFTASVKPGTRARPNEALDLLLDMNQMHLFDRKTGKSIYP